MQAQVLSQSMAQSPLANDMRRKNTDVVESDARTFFAHTERKHHIDSRPPAGFIQAIHSSKPPQSVASVNFSTMLEDSESLIRAYKKKKAELETLRDQFYQVET